MIALRAVVLGADGLGWIGRWLALVLGRLEALLLQFREGLLVVAPILRDGAGGCGLLPVVGARAVRLDCRARLGVGRRVSVGAAGVDLAGSGEDVLAVVVVPAVVWLGIGAGRLALGLGGLVVAVLNFAIGGLGLRNNYLLIVPRC